MQGFQKEMQGFHKESKAFRKEFQGSPKALLRPQHVEQDANLCYCFFSPNLFRFILKLQMKSKQERRQKSHRTLAQYSQIYII